MRVTSHVLVALAAVVALLHSASCADYLVEDNAIVDQCASAENGKCGGHKEPRGPSVFDPRTPLENAMDARSRFARLKPYFEGIFLADLVYLVNPANGYFNSQELIGIAEPKDKLLMRAFLAEVWPVWERALQQRPFSDPFPAPRMVFENITDDTTALDMSGVLDQSIFQRSAQRHNTAASLTEHIRKLPQSIPKITSLDLSNNSIGSDNMDTIYELLEKLPNLRALNLRNNSLNVQEVLQYIRTYKARLSLSLDVIDISDNKPVDPYSFRIHVAEMTLEEHGRTVWIPERWINGTWEDMLRAHHHRMSVPKPPVFNNNHHRSKHQQFVTEPPKPRGIGFMEDQKPKERSGGEEKDASEKAVAVDEDLEKKIALIRKTHERYYKGKWVGGEYHFK